MDGHILKIELTLFLRATGNYLVVILSLYIRKVVVFVKNEDSVNAINITENRGGWILIVFPRQGW